MRDENTDPRVVTGDAATDAPRAASTGGPASVISDVMGHVSSLVRKEVDLARTEISDNLKRAAVAVGLLVGAIVVALVALNVLAAALAAAIAEVFEIGGGWAALIVGGALALIALAMVSKGTKDLKLTSLAPSRTAKNVRRDADAVKETL
jgi:hypothetical protein